MSASVRKNTIKKRRIVPAGWSLLEMLLSMSLSVILLTSLFVLYYAAARGAARNESRSSAGRESRFVVDRFAREFKLVGLMAPADVNGDSNDINRDVPSQPWSDSLRGDFEYANTYDIVFTSDIDDDSCTETVRYDLDVVHHQIEETYWRWSRDSLRWRGPYTRKVGSQVDYLMFTYYDRDGNTIPNPLNYISGGYSLTRGERARITAVEVTVVTRSERSENTSAKFVCLPDGAYWYDKYDHLVQSFLVRGRNLSLGA
jgi:type II secretory pathway pseudopilin PulG